MNWKEKSYKAKKNSKRIDLGDIYKENKKSLSRFLKYLNESDEISPYHKEIIETGFCLGEIVYPKDIKWYIAKGLIYDFFDENEIIIEMKYTKISGDENYYEKYNSKIKMDIYKDKLYLYTFSCGVFDSRPEAEQAAFEKAFEILEQKL